MGMGVADVAGRLAASVGQLESVTPCFAPALDVPNAGVLCALPALLAIGLLDGVERHLQRPKGYYGLDSLLLAFMALARLPSIEALSYCAPGEWGNLLGLDQVPEVRLRSLMGATSMITPRRTPNFDARLGGRLALLAERTCDGGV